MKLFFSELLFCILILKYQFYILELQYLPKSIYEGNLSSDKTKNISNLSNLKELILLEKLLKIYFLEIHYVFRCYDKLFLLRRWLLGKNWPKMTVKLAEKCRVITAYDFKFYQFIEIPRSNFSWFIRAVKLGGQESEHMT